MQKRAVRLVLLALLLAAGAAAAYITLDTVARIGHGLDVEHEVEARLDRMLAAVSALGAEQQAYVAPGQQRGEALTRASVLVQQIYDDISFLRRTARSSDAGPALLTFGQTMDALVNLDDRAREHLRDAQDLLAADLVYTEARRTIDTMTGQLTALKRAEVDIAASERKSLLVRAGSVVGGVVLLWVLVVVVLVRVPAVPAAVPAASSEAVPSIETAAEPAAPSVDLQAAARVCTDLSRLSTDKGLAPALARAARVVDAPGLIVWLGAGEELFAATAHGYGPRTLARFGPIPRASNNATASAWRTAKVTTVPGNDGVNGAIVAPLFGPSGCFGVLAAEVRNGREKDESTRAVMTMIAAQLSNVVAPWPAPSYAEGTGPNKVEGPSEATTSSATEGVAPTPDARSADSDGSAPASALSA